MPFVQDVPRTSTEPVSVVPLVSPSTMGSKNVRMSSVIIQPGASTKPDRLTIEGIHYTAEGTGLETVAGQEIPSSPGTCVFIPIGAEHWVKNTGDKPLKIIAVTSPPVRA